MLDNEWNEALQDRSKLEILGKILPVGLFVGYLEEGFPFYFVNQKMVEYLGYDTAQELILDNDGSILNCIYSADRERIVDEARVMYAKRSKEYNSGIFRLRRKDGIVIWVVQNGLYVNMSDGREGLVSAYFDISEYKNLENQLELYRNSIKTSYFIMKFDDGYPLLFCNNSFYKIIGHNENSFREKCAKKIETLVYPKDLQMFHSITNESVYNLSKNIEWEMRIVSGDGKVCWINVRGFTIMENCEYLFKGTISNVTESHRLAEKINRSEERYKAALEGTNIGIWEYDLINNIFLRIHSSKELDFFPDIIEDMPYSLINQGIIHPDSQTDMILLCEKVKNGAPKAFADIKMVLPGGLDHNWQNIVLETIFDDDCNPLRAVCIIRDITQQKEAEIKYQNELCLRTALSSDGFVAGSRANITKDMVEFIESTIGRESLTTDRGYQQMILGGMDCLVNADDKGRYLNMFSRESLLSAYEQGHRTLSLDYRCKNQEGKLCWWNASIRLIRNTLTGDIYGYSSIRDITEQKSIELSISQRAERDPLTGAYNKETAMRMVDDAIAMAKNNNDTYAIIIFHLDDFNCIIQNGGYQTADSLVCELYSLLHSKTSEPKVIGRLFSDEMIVWVGGNEEQWRIFEEADNIRRIIRNSSVIPKTDFRVTLSVGIVFSGEDGPTREELLAKAREAMMDCLDSGGDSCVAKTYDKATQYQSNDRKVYSYNDDSVISNIIIECAFLLKPGRSFGKCIMEILRKVTEYYGADYGLFSKCNYDESNNLYTWSNNPSERKSKLTDEEVAAWVAGIFQNINHVIISDARTLEDERLFNYMKDRGLEGIYAVTLQAGGCILGYISFSNPTLNLGRLKLLETVACIVASELEKDIINKQNTYLKNYDEATGLLKRSSFLEYIEKIAPDALLSLGVIALDVNGLKQINNKYGRAYGDKIISITSDILKEIFADSYIFRIAGDEFSVICENVTLDAFWENIRMLKKSLEESYPGGITVGHVWSDTDINPESLIANADEKMMVAKQSYYSSIGTIVKHYNPVIKQKLLNEIKLGRYEMFLQPKATIRDNSISGSEALVRYRDENGTLVSPDKFIPQLELSGDIRYIDLFMFEQVCKILKRWQEWSFHMIPISLNFSRTTLLTENLISRMEEIHSRYKVPKSLIEIEVTESIGSVERQTLIHISSQIVEHGYRLSLDDFGAKYSNLSILSAMKLHVLKLDKSLVNDLFSNKNTRIVVRNFLITCKDLNIMSVAEGVETKEQLETLKNLGCDYAQGYYFNKPIPWSDFEKLYLSRDTLERA